VRVVQDERKVQDVLRPFRSRSEIRTIGHEIVLSLPHPLHHPVMALVAARLYVIDC
jgi:hypothetical protein